MSKYLNRLGNFYLISTYVKYKLRMIIIISNELNLYKLLLIKLFTSKKCTKLDLWLTNRDKISW